MNHASIDEDSKYAIDGIVKKNDVSICAIQIKPVSYLGNTSYLQTAHYQNREKNTRFMMEHGIPVFYAFYDDNNVIANRDELYGCINNVMRYAA